jgi:putative peptide zinc metalloprotease protein
MAANPSATFSESWYRVAKQHLSLRPEVRVRRQYYRGERWVVLENPFSNQFFRLRPEAYDFVARLRPDRTVEEVWKECLDRFPDTAPGQEAVIQLLSQLYFSNLLQYDMPEDAAQLFERYKKRRQKEIRSQFLNIMFMRFPLLDPDRFLVRTLPAVGWLISPIGGLLWLLVVGFGLKVVFDNFGGLRDEAQGVLSPGNLPLLYVALVILKTLHEFGHAYFCRKWGGEVHVMGLMLMIFTPVPYVDATSSWGFRSRWKRALVGAAGMIVELFVAAIAAVVWAQTDAGVVHSLAYNVMIVASVSTLIFNLNPLLRFDGYYILSDLIEVPNLHQRSTAQMIHVFERYLFGVKRSESPAATRAGAWGLGLFGVAALIYRIFVFGSILLLVADQFLVIGLLMAVFCLVSWVTVPLFKLIKYLGSSPKLERVRPRAIGAICGLVFGLLGLLQFVPLPAHFRAPGVVRAAERSELACETAGMVEEIIAKPGGRVAAGDGLVRLSNAELELDLAQTAARADEIEARLLKAMREETADLEPLRSARAAVHERREKLAADVENLVVRARHDGIWIAPGIEDYVGRWLTRGSNLGLLVNPERMEFVATVLQEDADAVFTGEPRPAEVRLMAETGATLPIAEWRVIPGEQRLLPSPALGWRGGGDVPVELDDERGNRASEPYFKVVGKLPAIEDAPAFDGVSGRMRFRLESEPLLPRWMRRLWQLLQKRYQV